MPLRIFSKSNVRPYLAIKAFGSAFALMACEPFVPGPGECPEFTPPCAQREYKVGARSGHWSNPLSNMVDSLPLELYFVENRVAIAKFSAGGGGRAHAYTCADCEHLFQADSIVFSTDLVTAGGDTLKAGFNFARDSLPAGIRGYATNWLEIDSLTGFRDSVFEVRFYGKISNVAHSATATLTVENPGLLLPR